MDASGLSQLQDLMAKAEFLKKIAQCIPVQFQLAWIGIQKHLGAIRKQVKIAQGIFDDMALDVTEIPRLDEIIEKIAKICKEFQGLFQENSPGFLLLEEITNLSCELATPFDFVYEVDTSMFGDHVWDVKKDTLYFGNFNKIRGLIDNLHDFYTLPGEAALPSRDSQLEMHLEALRSAGGRLLDEFLPGVVYKEVPEVVEEIEKTGEMIAKILGPCLSANEHDFFKNEIKKARDCLAGLVVSEKIRDTKPLKLEGFMGIKDKVKDLVTLFQLLQF